MAQQLTEPDVQKAAEQAAAERDARYRGMLTHERFCLPGQGQTVARVEQYKAYRDVAGVSVPLSVIRCQECGANLITPLDKEIL